MRLTKKVILGLLGAAFLGVATTATAVACANGNVAQPYNSSTAKYAAVAPVAARGYFATTTGLAIQNATSPLLLSELVSTYPALGIKNPNASIAGVTYTPGSEANFYNDGKINILVDDYQEMNNEGISVTITGIMNKAHPPYPTNVTLPPTNQTILTTILFPKQTMTVTSLGAISLSHWTAILQYAGIIPWNFTATGITVATHGVTVVTTGLYTDAGITKSGTISVHVNLPTVANHLQTKVLDVDAATLMKSATGTSQSPETLEAFFQESQYTILSQLNAIRAAGVILSPQKAGTGAWTPPGAGKPSGSAPTWSFNNFALYTQYSSAGTSPTVSLFFTYVIGPGNDQPYEVVITGFQTPDSPAGTN